MSFPAKQRLIGKIHHFDVFTFFFLNIIKIVTPDIRAWNTMTNNIYQNKIFLKRFPHKRTQSRCLTRSTGKQDESTTSQIVLYLTEYTIKVALYILTFAKLVSRFFRSSTLMNCTEMACPGTGS